MSADLDALHLHKANDMHNPGYVDYGLGCGIRNGRSISRNERKENREERNESKIWNIGS